MLNCAGQNINSQLGVPASQAGVKVEKVSIEINLDRIQSISATNDCTFVLNDNKIYYSGVFGDLRSEQFNLVSFDDNICVNLACGNDFLLINSKKLDGSFIHMKDNSVSTIGNDIIGSFAGESKFGLINQNGSIIYRKPDETIQINSEKVIELALCEFFVVALAISGKVFIQIKSIKNNKFLEIKSLVGIKIKKISGTCNTCAAISEDGRVFTFGNNSYGQLCDGTTRDNFQKFKEVSFFHNKRVKDVSCSDHILFLTEDDELYGAGCNDFYQLFKKTNIACIKEPILISKDERIANIHAGYKTSYYTSGVRRYENQCKIYFDALSQLESSINQEETTPSSQSNKSSSCGVYSSGWCINSGGGGSVSTCNCSWGRGSTVSTKKSIDTPMNQKENNEDQKSIIDEQKKTIDAQCQEIQALKREINALKQKNGNSEK